MIADLIRLLLRLLLVNKPWDLIWAMTCRDENIFALYWETNEPARKKYTYRKDLRLEEGMWYTCALTTVQRENCPGLFQIELGPEPPSLKMSGTDIFDENYRSDWGWNAKYHQAGYRAYKIVNQIHFKSWVFTRYAGKPSKLGEWCWSNQFKTAIEYVMQAC